MIKKCELSKRVSGEKYEEAKERLDLIISSGGIVDEFGYVKLYHRTSEENAKEIVKTKRMFSKDDAIYFSTLRDGQNFGYGEVALEFTIPVEKILEDDIFPDKDGNCVEIHFTLPLFAKKMVNVEEYLCS